MKSKEKPNYKIETLDEYLSRVGVDKITKIKFGTRLNDRKFQFRFRRPSSPKKTG